MFQRYVSRYLEYCRLQKNLNEKTLTAYEIDLRQFCEHVEKMEIISAENSLRILLTEYFAHMHEIYRPRSVKRKIASLKAFFNYLEYEEILEENPFNKIRMRYKEPELLPRTIPVNSLQKILSAAYRNRDCAEYTEYQHRVYCRDVAVLELLFSTGVRVSELCSIKKSDIDIAQGTLRIYGKGARERMLYLTDWALPEALKIYNEAFRQQIEAGELFFYNRLGNRLSEQSVRFMIRRYAEAVHAGEHITPHMFRHTFATLLLEEDVDIRYIQQILGHSSITTTQIYTHVALEKQREILRKKHPRNRLVVG